MTSVQLVSNEDPRLIPAWAADTLYAVGHQVIAPSRTLVEAKVEHTSGATYEAEHWQTPLADVTAETARAETAETSLATSITKARANADTALSTGITSAIATAEAASDAVGTAAADGARGREHDRDEPGYRGHEPHDGRRWSDRHGGGRIRRGGYSSSRRGDRENAGASC
jgi:hypothetical protein